MSIDTFFASLFVLVSTAVLSGFLLGMLFVKRLKEHHTKLWLRLGSPGFFDQGWGRSSLREFVRSQEYRDLQDKQLKLLGRICIGIVPLVWFSIILGAILIVYNRMT